MIRINLLAVERERTKKKAIIPVAQRTTLAASLILIGTALLIAWWFWSLHQASVQVDADMARAEVELQQLRSVLTQVQKFESRKAQLQQRVSLIEQLRRGQSGPVHLLDEVSKALPERLWLTEMHQTGDDLTMTGMTTSLTGLSDFVSNLEASPWFVQPIDIIDSQTDPQVKTTELVKFSVKARFHNPEAPSLPPGGRGVPPAGRGAPPPARGNP
jgi:type IV pilus assembly protein PilN